MSQIRSFSHIADKCINYANFLDKKFVVQTKPKAFALKKLNISALKIDTLHLPEPKKYSSQSERLKAFFASKDIPLVEPSKEWSDNKVLAAVGLINKKFDELIRAKRLGPYELQDAVENIVPEVKDKLFICDHTKMKSHMDYLAWPKEVQQGYLNSAAAVLLTPRRCFMYIKFKNSATKYEIIQLKEQIGHELKHVFSKQKQNSDSIITYKVQHCKGKSFQRVFGKIFSQFENSYCGKYRLKQKDPTQKNMLKHYGFKSIEQLHKDFESKLNTLVKENDLASVPQLGVDKRSWKTFYDFLRLYAKDEKEAYLSSKVYRENFRDLSKPTNGEFDSLLYAEMEKFFAQKRIEANKLYI